MATLALIHGDLGAATALETYALRMIFGKVIKSAEVLELCDVDFFVARYTRPDLKLKPKTSAGKSFRNDHVTVSIPKQHSHVGCALVERHMQVSRCRIAAQDPLHKARQAIERLSQVDEDVHACLAFATDRERRLMAIPAE